MGATILNDHATILTITYKSCEPSRVHERLASQLCARGVEVMNSRQAGVARGGVPTHTSIRISQHGLLSSPSNTPPGPPHYLPLTTCHLNLCLINKSFFYYDQSQAFPYVKRPNPHTVLFFTLHCMLSNSSSQSHGDTLISNHQNIPEQRKCRILQFNDP